jgi:hypothetical protein
MISGQINEHINALQLSFLQPAVGEAVTVNESQKGCIVKGSGNSPLSQLWRELIGTATV